MQDCSLVWLSHADRATAGRSAARDRGDLHRIPRDDAKAISAALKRAGEWLYSEVRVRTFSTMKPARPIFDTVPAGEEFALVSRLQ